MSYCSVVELIEFDNGVPPFPAETVKAAVQAATQARRREFLLSQCNRTLYGSALVGGLESGIFRSWDEEQIPQMTKVAIEWTEAQLRARASQVQAQERIELFSPLAWTIRESQSTRGAGSFCQGTMELLSTQSAGLFCQGSMEVLYLRADTQVTALDQRDAMGYLEPQASVSIHFELPDFTNPDRTYRGWALFTGVSMLKRIELDGSGQITSTL